MMVAAAVLVDDTIDGNILGGQVRTGSDCPVRRMCGCLLTVTMPNKERKGVASACTVGDFP